MGRITSIVSGSGGALQQWSYGWQANGNLQTRHDALSGAADTREWFEYDNLHRLTAVKRGVDAASAVLAESYGYDTKGNLRSKGGQTLGYGTQGSCAMAPGPHALSSGFGSTFCYDANGNQISERGGNTRDISYSVFGLPTSITRSGADTSYQATSTQFSYTPERGRWKRVETIAGATTTTITVGGNEFVVRPGMVAGALEIKRALAGGTLDTRTFSTRTTQTSRELTWLFKDHLGSVDVVATLDVGSQVLIKQRMQFDAFGARRTSATQSLPPWLQTTFNTRNTTRGYTGHEQADGAGLIHMNGRMYDARLGRFVQADPIVQDLYDTQSYNRYSYVMNRPLSLTDPTGYVAFDGEYYRYAQTGNDYSGSAQITGELSGAIAQGHMAFAANQPLAFAYRAMSRLEARGNLWNVSPNAITHQLMAMVGSSSSADRLSGRFGGLGNPTAENLQAGGCSAVECEEYRQLNRRIVEQQGQGMLDAAEYSGKQAAEYYLWNKALGALFKVGGAARRGIRSLFRRGASFGQSTTNAYRTTFLQAHPGLEGKVIVHHAVEQRALRLYPGIVTEAEMHSLENLRGIPIGANSELHLSFIRVEWNKFYRQNPTTTKEALLKKADEIDRMIGSQFLPPR